MSCSFHSSRPCSRVQAVLIASQICQEPMPMHPTPSFNAAHDKYRARPPDADSDEASSFCAMHKTLIRTIPLARHRNYPESIDYATIWEKIIGVPWIQKRVQNLCARPEYSPIYRKHEPYIHDYGRMSWIKKMRDQAAVEDASPG